MLIRRALMMAVVLVTVLMAQTTSPFAPPVTFRGKIPCADCPGIVMTLTLYPKNRFTLRQEYLERKAILADVGFWRVEDGKLTVHGREGKAQNFQIADQGMLEMLDTEGKPIESQHSYRLWRTATPEQEKVPAELLGVEWRLRELNGRPVREGSGQRKPFLKLESEGRASASGGCNGMGGSYTVQGSSLAFGAMMGTLMACESSIMEVENGLSRVLTKANGYRMEEGKLLLLTGDQVVARFEASGN